MAELSDKFPDEMRNKQINSESFLTFEIVEIQPNGLVQIEFSEPVFQLEQILREREVDEIDIKYCVTEQCDQIQPDVQSKPWIEVLIIAGEDSDPLKLNFTWEARFIANDKMYVLLSFEYPIEVSLFKQEETLVVKLWGPFLSAAELSPISNEDLLSTKAVPP